MIKFVETEKSPEALGHYSQGTVANGFIFTATQLPINPANPSQEKGNIQEQAEQVLSNVINVVEAGGGDVNTIVKIMIYVSDSNHWTDVNIAYEQLMGKNKPARGVLEIQNIRKGYDVSMDAVAVVKG